MSIKIGIKLLIVNVLLIQYYFLISVREDLICSEEGSGWILFHKYAQQQQLFCHQKKSFSNLFIHDLIVLLDTERDRGINLPGEGICLWWLGSHGHETVN